MDKQVFTLSNAQRTLLEAFCKKKWFKKEITKSARKIRYTKEPSVTGNADASQSSSDAQTRIKKEVIELETTRTSVDEFLEVTEKNIDRLFYQGLPVENLREVSDSCKKVDELVIPLIMELTPEHIELINNFSGQSLDDPRPTLESLRDANHELLEAVSGKAQKDKLNSAAEEFTLELAIAYQDLFNEKPTSTNKFYHYLKMTIDLVSKDFGCKIKTSPKIVKKILKKSQKSKK
jgi:hypothetical protein